MLKWGQSRCEVAQREPVRRGRIVQTRSTWKHVWILLVCAADVTLMKFGRQLPESDQNPHKCKSAKCSSGRRYKRSSMETVISTRMPHEAKRNSMVSKCRTRQPESCGTLSASVHDWLERGVWTEPPTDLRLNDGRCWQLVNALLLSSPGVSVRSSGSTHMTSDAKHGKNLASLPEVKSLMPEWSTAARSVMSRGGVGAVSCLDSSEPRTARATRRKTARTSQSQCARSTCRW